MTIEELKLVLEQVEATAVEFVGDCGDPQCSGCRVDMMNAEKDWKKPVRYVPLLLPEENQSHGYGDGKHRDGCRYVRVKKILVAEITGANKPGAKIPVLDEHGVLGRPGAKYIRLDDF